jgi:Fic family protein
MARKYIHELAGWPEFTWDSKILAPLLSEVRLHRGLLLGRMRSYGFASQWTATLKVLTEETIKSSAIEGVVLDPENVRSSLARRLGLKVGGLKTHKDLGTYALGDRSFWRRLRRSRGFLSEKDR